MFYVQETRMVRHYIKWREMECFFLFRNEKRGPFSTLSDMVFEDSAITTRQEKGTKGNKTGKEEVKLFLFPDYRILFLNNSVV